MSLSLKLGIIALGKSISLIYSSEADYRVFFTMRLRDNFFILLVSLACSIASANQLVSTIPAATRQLEIPIQPHTLRSLRLARGIRGTRNKRRRQQEQQDDSNPHQKRVNIYTLRKRKKHSGDSHVGFLTWFHFTMSGIFLKYLSSLHCVSS